VKKDFDPDKLRKQFEAMRNAQGIDDTVSNMNSSFHSKSAVTTNTEKQKKQEQEEKKRLRQQRKKEKETAEWDEFFYLGGKKKPKHKYIKMSDREISIEKRSKSPN
jgi:hypothetical protein